MFVLPHRPAHVVRHLSESALGIVLRAMAFPRCLPPVNATSDMHRYVDGLVRRRVKRQLLSVELDPVGCEGRRGVKDAPGNRGVNRRAGDHGAPASGKCPASPAASNAARRDFPDG